MRTVISSAVLVLVAAGGAWGQTSVDLGPAKDNTLYQSGTGSLSNGAGSYMFTGLTVGFSVRRALVEFDIAGQVPAGATIESVRLTLDMSRTTSPESNVALHRASQEWGEGASNAPGEEGGGATAQDGDATWLHAIFHPAGGSVLWSNAGGDYDASASAVTGVEGPGTYTWSSEQMAADVQAWLDDPSSNHGWMIIGDEKTVSSKRYSTREDPTAGNRPVLTVTYSEEAECPPDFTGDDVLDFFDVQQFLQLFSQMDPAADFTEDGLFDFFDVQEFLQLFSAGCP
jgi:hypothetical protein